MPQCYFQCSDFLLKAISNCCSSVYLCFKAAACRQARDSLLHHLVCPSLPREFFQSFSGQLLVFPSLIFGQQLQAISFGVSVHQHAAELQRAVHEELQRGKHRQLAADHTSRTYRGVQSSLKGCFLATILNHLSYHISLTCWEICCRMSGRLELLVS